MVKVSESQKDQHCGASFLLWKKCQINVLADYMYIWLFRCPKSVVLEGSLESALKWQPASAADGQDIAWNCKKSKKNSKGLGIFKQFSARSLIVANLTNSHYWLYALQFWNIHVIRQNICFHNFLNILNPHLRDNLGRCRKLLSIFL